MGLYFKDNKPFIEDQNLLELTSKVSTPFYIYSQKSIEENYNKLKRRLKREIFYSVKANSNQSIIKLLDSIGAGIDVVSVEELKRALKAKVSPSKIIFEGVGKSEKDIEFAITKNIRQINVESIEELILIDEISKKLNNITSIGIRINPDIDARSLDKISTGRRTDKFGIGFRELSNVCDIIKNSEKIKFEGLSCHIGSQIFELSTFEKFFLKMKDAVNIFKEHNLNIQHLDLGGGFGVSYSSDNKELDFSKLALLVEKIFPDPGFEISFEPGRYLVATSGFLLTKILINKKNSDNNFLITDAGMQTFLRTAIYNSFHKIISLKKEPGEIKYHIAGPICESSDILGKDVLLPKQYRNDFLLICDVGAYGSVMASNYNSKCLPAEVLIFENKYKVIRESQTLESVINNDNIAEWL